MSVPFVRVIVDSTHIPIPIRYEYLFGQVSFGPDDRSYDQINMIISFIVINPRFGPPVPPSFFSLQRFSTFRWLPLGGFGAVNGCTVLVRE